MKNEENREEIKGGKGLLLIREVMSMDGCIEWIKRKNIGKSNIDKIGKCVIVIFYFLRSSLF